MDLSLHGRILRRYWQVVAAGVVVALVLAVLSAARPALNGVVPTLVYRSNELWQSNATLLITRSGFQEGRLFPSAEQGRFYQLADLYAQLATSDGVMKILRKRGPVTGKVTATALPSSTDGPSPLVKVFATGPSPAKARALTQSATAAFLTYLDRQQREARIRPNNRVEVSVVRRVEPALLLEPRKKTLPVMIFLAVLSATAALVYVLEQMKARRQSEPTVRPVTAAAAGPRAEDGQEEKRDEELVATRRWG